MEFGAFSYNAEDFDLNHIKQILEMRSLMAEYTGTSAVS